MDTIIKIMKDNQYTGHLVVIDDEVYMQGLCGGFEKDERDFNTILELLKGCVLQVKTMSVRDFEKALLGIIEEEKADNPMLHVDTEKDFPSSPLADLQIKEKEAA
ncbi:MAG: hypothetical protein FD156_1192 [Nitrospirae bacterium]|nr:MAG: hypothetical protein FD156_1192 [Nitrospirota bacterium]